MYVIFVYTCIYTHIYIYICVSLFFYVGIHCDYLYKQALGSPTPKERVLKRARPSHLPLGLNEP